MLTASLDLTRFTKPDEDGVSTALETLMGVYLEAEIVAKKVHGRVLVPKKNKNLVVPAIKYGKRDWTRQPIHSCTCGPTLIEALLSSRPW